MKQRRNTAETWSDILRKAAQASGQTCYRLAFDAKIGQTRLRRFMAGETGLSLPAAERLADVLDLDLRPRDKK